MISINRRVGCSHTCTCKKTFPFSPSILKWPNTGLTPSEIRRVFSGIFSLFTLSSSVGLWDVSGTGSAVERAFNISSRAYQQPAREHEGNTVGQSHVERWSLWWPRSSVTSAAYIGLDHFVLALDTHRLYILYNTIDVKGSRNVGLEDMRHEEDKGEKSRERRVKCGWRWWIESEITEEKGRGWRIRWVVFLPSLLSCREEKSHHLCHFLSTVLFHSGLLGILYCFPCSSRRGNQNLFSSLALLSTYLAVILSFCHSMFVSFASQRHLKCWHSIGIIRIHIDCVTAAKCACAYVCVWACVCSATQIQANYWANILRISDVFTTASVEHIVSLVCVAFRI